MMAMSGTTDSLRGSVKELTARTVTLSEKGEEFQSLRFVAFDRAGNKVEEAMSQPDGSSFFKNIYAYDLRNKLVEQSSYGANELLYSKTVYEYDSSDRLVERRTFDSDGNITGTQRPAYTDEGLRIEEETLTLPEDADVNCLIDVEGTDMLIPSDGARKFRKIYDSAGKLLEVSLFGDDGACVRKTLLNYQNGRLIEVEQYSSSNGFYPCGERTGWQRAFDPLILRLVKATFFLKCVYSFGVRGEMKKLWRSFAYGSVTMSNVFVYDDEGRVVEEQTFFVGSLMIKKVFAYDAGGNKAEEIETVRGDSIVQKQIYAREYDARGNWIKEIISHRFSTNEQLQESKTVTHRDISYY